LNISHSNVLCGLPKKEIHHILKQFFLTPKRRF
jgi:hypothetical protein